MSTSAPSARIVVHPPTEDNCLLPDAPMGSVSSQQFSSRYCFPQDTTPISCLHFDRGEPGTPASPPSLSKVGNPVFPFDSRSTGSSRARNSYYRSITIFLRAVWQPQRGTLVGPRSGLARYVEHAAPVSSKGKQKIGIAVSCGSRSIEIEIENGRMLILPAPLAIP
jgi:hypothetical protein